MKISYNDNDVRFLLRTLSAIINEEELPSSLNRVSPSVVFRLSNMHNIANILHYYVLGTDDKIMEDVKKSFYASYSASLLALERNKNVQKEVLWVLENAEIEAVLIKGAEFCNNFPRKEMCEPDVITLLINHKNYKDVNNILESIDFSLKNNIDSCHFVYKKTPSCTIHLLTDNALGDREMKKFALRPDNLIPYTGNYNFIKKYSVNDFYVFSMCYMVNAYAYKRLKLRDMLDFWMFFRKNEDDIQWDYVIDKLNRLNVRELGLCLLELCMVMFENESIDSEEKLDLYDSMQHYIISFGTEKFKVGAEDFPIVIQLRMLTLNAEKEMQKRLDKSYLYPDQEHMLMLYPRLAKTKLGLRLAWLLRRIRILFNAKPSMNEYYLLTEDDNEEEEENIATMYEPQSDIIEEEEEGIERAPIMVAKDVKILSDNEEGISLNEKGGAGLFTTEEDLMEKYYSKKKSKNKKK